MSELITINGAEDLPDPAYGGIAWSMQDVDFDSGRTADGTMHRNRVARKRKISVTWPAMPREDVKKVLSSMTDESFSVRVWDFEKGAYDSMTAYVGDRTIPYLSSVIGGGWCDSFTCNFVEL